MLEIKPQSKMRFVHTIIGVLLIGTGILCIYHIVILFSNLDALADSSEINTTTETAQSIVNCDDVAINGEPCFGLVMTIRDEWLAQPQHFPIGKLELPAVSILLTDTKTDECRQKPKCKYLVRDLQGSHVISNGDINYNFLINTLGEFYEGRGWNLQSAESIYERKKNTYWIAFIGNFTEIPVWQQQVRAVKNFAAKAISVGKLNASFNLYCSSNILFSVSGGRVGSDDDYVKCPDLFEMSSLKIT